jgi:hypothetical protein
MEWYLFLFCHCAEEQIDPFGFLPSFHRGYATKALNDYNPFCYYDIN